MKKTRPLSPLGALVVLLASAGITVLLLVGLNMAVDPYGVRPVNAFLRLPLKSRRSIEKNEYLHKAYAIQSARPEVVYLGNSRVSVGLPADEEIWKAKAYNCGLAAAGPEEILAYLRHALSLGCVHRVVLGFDAVTFFGPPSPPPTFDAGLLLTGPNTRVRPAFMCPGIFSLGAVTESMKTLLRQRGTDVVAYRNGVHDGDGMRAQIKGDSAWASQQVVDLGHHQLSQIAAFRPEDDSKRVVCAREMAELCRVSGVKVVVLFLPIHHTYADLMTSEGVSERVRKVQEQVLACFEDAGLPSLVVQDFSHDQPRALDGSFESDGSKVWKWWWEVSHFRAEYGREIVDQLALRSKEQADHRSLSRVESAEKTAR